MSIPRMNIRLTPGAFVRHPDLPDWGLGQVQSAIGERVTVNFENAGKQLINTAAIPLIEVDPKEEVGQNTGGPHHG
ncbi:MAG TPA: DUF3553 domain-containing protein [Candidatus Udaeobacter sp.]|nr:DUF3553 domain-containing protein [Candidatus Udaeobacter sp.]